MKKPVKDMAASVRQLLQNVAKKTNRPFQEVLEYFAMEQWLYRLANSKYANQFVLKGALMFKVWNAPASRPPRDIDLLGRMDNKVTAIVPVFKDICNQTVEPRPTTGQKKTKTS